MLVYQRVNIYFLQKSISYPNFFGYRFRIADFLYAWALRAGRDWKSIFLFGSVRRREGTEGRTVSTAKLVPRFLGKAQAGCNTSALNTSNSLGRSSDPDLRGPSA